MTLEQVKELLTNNRIVFEQLEFSSEAEYWHYTALFPYTKNAKCCKVIAVVIESNNEKKNIELQFNKTDDCYIFEELRFGDYCFEMFDYNEEMLSDDLLDRISEIRSGNFVVIVANDIKKKHQLGDACFDINDDDEDFGKPGFQKAIQHIKKPKGFISKLLKTNLQYEIYDWNSYQCIIK